MACLGKVIRLNVIFHLFSTKVKNEFFKVHQKFTIGEVLQTLVENRWCKLTLLPSFTMPFLIKIIRLIN